MSPELAAIVRMLAALAVDDYLSELQMHAASRSSFLNTSLKTQAYAIAATRLNPYPQED